MSRGVVGLQRLGHSQAQGFGDERPARRIIPIHEGHGGTGVAGAACASNAVDVDLLVFGALVVDDMGDIVDVNAARGDIRCDEDIDFALAEGPQSLLARALAQIAVKGAHREASCGQVLTEVRGRAFRAAEDD